MTRSAQQAQEPTTKPQRHLTRVSAIVSLPVLVAACGAAPPVAPTAPAAAQADVATPVASSCQDRWRDDGGTRRVGLLVGHGATMVDDPLVPPLGALASAPTEPPKTLRMVLAQHSAHRLVEVDLKGGAAEVDPSLEALIIAQPTSDLTPAELRRVDEYVLRGRGLVAVSSAVHVAAGDATMQAVLRPSSIRTLLAGYGIEQHTNVALDFGQEQRMVMSAQGIAALRTPALIDVASGNSAGDKKGTIDHSFAPFAKITSTSMPFASSLTLHPEVQPRAKLRVIVRSGPKTALETNPTVDLSPTRAWATMTPAAAQNLVAIVEGPLKSALGAPKTPAGPSRVMVISSSGFLGNPYLRAAGANTQSELLQLAQRHVVDNTTGTIFAVIGALDWATACAIK